MLETKRAASPKNWLALCALIAAVVVCLPAASARAQTAGAPLLLTEGNTTRAVALDSVTFRREPFSPAAAVARWSADSRTRVMLFATNLEGATAADVVAEAEDGAGRRHALPVEFVGLVQGATPQSLSQIVFRVPDSLDNAGDVLVRVSRGGAASNRVRIGFGFVGGGPPDDVLRITGRVRAANNAALAGVILTLGGATSATAATDAQGNYSFSNLVPGGNYTVTAAKQNYTFAPPSASFTRLVAVSTADFVAALLSYKISGQITERGRPMAGVRVELSGALSAVAATDAQGNYSFDAPAEGNYLVRPFAQAPTRFNPSSFAVNNLNSDQTQNFVSAVGDLTFSISGFVMRGGAPLPGATVTLSGARSATAITDTSGFYAFASLPEGDYALAASKDHHTFAPQSLSFPDLQENKRADFDASVVSYSIGGRITEGSSPLVGVTVTLSGSRASTTTTDGQGNYSFNVPAEGDYVVAPTSAAHSFSPSSFAVFNLSGNRTQNFASNSTRQFHSISGFVKAADGTPISGVSIQLVGLQTPGALTDANGFYGILGLPAGESYTIAAAKDGFSFAPPTITFPNLSANQQGQFTAVFNEHTLSGRLTDADGRPFAGVPVELTGTRTATATSDATGFYSFTVPALGNYVITPMGDFNYTPGSQNFDYLLGNRTANFAAIDPNRFYVMLFDGSQQTVDYGDFFLPHLIGAGRDDTLGHFFWEFWAMPGQNALSRYMLSDGYGGAHAILFGFTAGRGDGRYSLTGNVWNGSTALQFGSDDGPAPGEWGHYAVGWDGREIITYFNGVPVGAVAFTGPRRPAGSDNGGGRLFIGGSDHNNFDGHIAQARGFEGTNPLTVTPTGIGPTSAFRPDHLFSLRAAWSPTVPSKFLTNFLRPSPVVPDLAGGRVGIIRGTANGAPDPRITYPLPQYVIDPKAPTTSSTTPPVAPAVLVDDPLPAPQRAAVFDSFSRKNSTYAFGGPGGLGSTESGTAGAKNWKEALVPGGGPTKGPFGILNGRAVTLTDYQGPSLAWVDHGSPTNGYEVTVERAPGFWGSGINTGLCFRVADSTSFFFAYTGGLSAASGQVLTVGYYKDGVPTFLATNVPIPAGWSRLTVGSNAAGVINVSANDTLLYTGNMSLLADAPGVGIYNFAPGLALRNRWDNFTVYHLSAP